MGRPPLLRDTDKSQDRYRLWERPKTDRELKKTTG